MRNLRYISSVLMIFLFSCEKFDLLEEVITIPAEVCNDLDTCYVWNGHLVVSEHRTSDNATELTLLSLYEWSDMPSANHVADSALVHIVAEGYQEMDLSEWHVPTLEEAKPLRAAYGEGSTSLERLNLILSEVEASPMSNEARYLCNDGQKSFSLADGTSISNAGSKSVGYRLRLMKRVLNHNLYELFE